MIGFVSEQWDITVNASHFLVIWSSSNIIIMLTICKYGLCGVTTCKTNHYYLSPVIFFLLFFVTVNPVTITWLKKKIIVHNQPPTRLLAYRLVHEKRAFHCLLIIWILTLHIQDQCSFVNSGHFVRFFPFFRVEIHSNKKC